MNNKSKLIPRKLIGGLIPKFESPFRELKRRMRDIKNRAHHVKNGMKRYTPIEGASGYYLDNITGNLMQFDRGSKTYKLVAKKGQAYKFSRNRNPFSSSYGTYWDGKSSVARQARVTDDEYQNTIQGKGRVSPNHDRIMQAHLDAHTLAGEEFTGSNYFGKRLKDGRRYHDFGNGRIQIEGDNREFYRNSLGIYEPKSTNTKNLNESKVVKNISTANTTTSTASPITSVTSQETEYIPNNINYQQFANNVLNDVDKRIAEISPRINSTDPYGEMMNAMKGWDLKRKQKMMDASVGTAWDWNTEAGRKAFTGMAQYLKNGKGDYQKAYDLYLASQNTPKLEMLNNNFYANLSNDVKNMKLNLPEFKFTFDPESPTFAQLYTPPQLNLKLNSANNIPFVNYSGPDAWLDDLSWKKDLNSAYNRYLSTFARKGAKLIPRNNGFK